LTKVGYKITEIGEIPEEWACHAIGDPEISVNTKAGGTPLRSKKEYYEHGNIPFVKIADIVNSGKYLDNTAEKINENGIKNSSSWVTPSYSILFSMYASYGELTINKIPIATNQAILSIIPNKFNIDLEYFYYQLKFLKPRLVKYLRYTTQNNLNAGVVNSLIIPIAPLPEQQKIAEILSTADDEIQRVDEQITLTEQFKKGLMQRLLTRGIGHTRFKITEIGEIPEEWSVKTIRDCSAPTSNINPPSIFGKDEFYYVDVSGISSEKLAITETKKIRGIDSPSRARKLIKKDDVIFATIRPYLKRVAIVPENLDGNICSTAFCVIRAKRNIILPSFLYYYAILDNFVNRVSGLQTGSAYPAVSDDQILSELIVIPKLHEQQKIAEILSTTDNKLELLRDKRDKLDVLKKGLMNDLLTGKVRVKV